MGRGWAPSAVWLRWRCMQLAETEWLYLYLGFRSGGIWPSGRALVCSEAVSVVGGTVEGQHVTLGGPRRPPPPVLQAGGIC